MLSNAKRNEHPRCGCRMCRMNAGSNYGKLIHRKVNRAIRHAYRLALGALRNTHPIQRREEDDDVRIIKSTGYTD